MCGCGAKAGGRGHAAGWSGLKKGNMDTLEVGVKTENWPRCYHCCNKGTAWHDRPVPPARFRSVIATRMSGRESCRSGVGCFTACRHRAGCRGARAAWFSHAVGYGQTVTSALGASAAASGSQPLRTCSGCFKLMPPRAPHWHRRARPSGALGAAPQAADSVTVTVSRLC